MVKPKRRKVVAKKPRLRKVPLKDTFKAEEKAELAATASADAKKRTRKLSATEAPDVSVATNTNQPITTVAVGPERKRSASSKPVVQVEDADVNGEPEEQEDRRGIVHLGQVPAGMQPEKLRHMMSQFGDVGRVFLAPEDKTEHQRRRKTGGNRKMRYTEGWVEFAERKIARRVALTLNATPIGGRKRHNFFRDDMWNVRYLPKFKWHQLKEVAIYNLHVRKARLEQKLGQARRENEFFLEQVEKGKIWRRIERKNEEKGRSLGRLDGAGGGRHKDLSRGAIQEVALGRPEFPVRSAPSSGAPPASRQISDTILSNLF